MNQASICYRTIVYSIKLDWKSTDFMHLSQLINVQIFSIGPKHILLSFVFVFSASNTSDGFRMTLPNAYRSWIHMVLNSKMIVQTSTLSGRQNINLLMNCSCTWLPEHHARFLISTCVDFCQRLVIGEVSQTVLCVSPVPVFHVYQQMNPSCFVRICRPSATAESIVYFFSTSFF